MPEDQPIPAGVTGVISGEAATISKPALSRADNGDPVLHPRGLAELGDQGIVFDAHGTLLWAQSSDGEKIRFGFVSQMLESVKIKRPISEDEKHGIRSLPARLIRTVRKSNQYDYAYPNLPPDFFGALSDFYQAYNSRIDDNSQPLEETEQQPKPAEVAGAVTEINSYRSEHRWPNGRQMTRSEVVDRLYGEPPAESSSRTHETMAQTRMRLMPGRPISGPVEGPNW